MMSARAIYKAQLCLDSLEVPIKFYSGVEDRGIHFRLLHEADHEPVVQQLIDKTTEEPVERNEVHKAYQLDDRRLVKLEPAELEELEPPGTRDVSITRFIPPNSIDYALYERPYYLGPDGDAESYFALAHALGQRKVEGLAHWVMRKRAYVGALREHNGYLMLVTLRHQQEVIELASFARTDNKELSKQELQLAQQLIETLEGSFDIESFHDDYREQVQQLIARKAKGQVIPLRPRKKPAPAPDLAEALQNSLKSIKRKKTA